MKQKLTKYPITVMLIVLISLITGCEDRLWDNPRDKNSSLGRDEWAPQNLTAEQISVSSARLSWVQIENEIDGFIIDRKIGDFGWLSEYAKIKLDTTMVSGWIDTAFIPDPNLVHQYRLKAYAYDETSIAVTKSLKPVFPPPVNLLIDQLSDTVLKLNWTDNSLGEDGFMIDRKIDNGQWILGFSQTAENESQWSDSNTVYGKTHFYRVCGYKADKKSQSIESQIVNIIPIPKNLVATVIDDQSLQLTWTDNCAYEAGFRIERNDGSGFTQIAEVNENVTKYTDAGLNYRQNYSYRVKAFTINNESGDSNEILTSTIFAAPSNLLAIAIDDQSIQLTWTDNCAYESGFRIERDDGSGFTQIAEVYENVTAYTDAGLTYGQSYSYRVRAFTDTNESDYSNESNTVEMIISAPTNLAVSVIDDQSLQLNWTDKCTFESGFRIERDDGSGFTQIAEVDENVTTYTDAGLTYGQSYSYRVKAFTTNNESDYSNESNIVMAIPAPTNLIAEIIDNLTVRLTWEDNCTFEIGYKVERKEEGGAFAEIADLGTNTETYTDQGLNTDIRYIFRIYAYTAIHQSDYSSEFDDPRWITDIDGNIYKTVKIGDQWWMAENLKVTHYRNGDAIPHVTEDTEWSNLTSGAYCEYDNNSANVDTYGRLYNWYAVDDSRNIAPEGWHSPTDMDWKQLEMALGMSQSEAYDTGYRGTNEGSKMAIRADLWADGNLENNAEFGTSGFAALPAGYRYSSGFFHGIGLDADFWSSAESGRDHACYRHLDYGSSEVDRDDPKKQYGFSVRLVRD